MKCPFCDGTGVYTPSLGEMIKMQRERLGLSQTELANRCGTSRTLITMVETNKSNLSMDSLRAILAALDGKLEIVFEPPS